jgi:hypothetical protein
VENDQEAIQPRTTSTGCAETRKYLDSIVREALFRQSALYGQELNPAWLPVWLEALSDLNLAVVRAAFTAVEQTFVPTAACPFPVPAHVRKFAENLEESADNSEAELAWQRALNLRRSEWNRDIPGRFQEIFRALPVQEQQACRASGIFAQSDIDPEALHVWCKKRFLESYLRWKEHARSCSRTAP